MQDYLQVSIRHDKAGEMENIISQTKDRMNSPIGSNGK